ncbi:hypothetical protein ILUMI_04176 [Ignelater luminosus]|uniref:Peptidase S1 domain-containing protein n=1 Tax=Ignelater luminosus TaxID=2038154 RepID=A0A8K0GJT7_IGNLU|nr:hypothetical protein ILUMI_04176 [Ignelater luminosus]
MYDSFKQYTMKRSSYVLLCILIFFIKIKRQFTAHKTISRIILVLTVLDLKTARSKQMYIVGGKEVDIKTHPYVVSIIIKYNERISFRGAATIVHRRFAMSTAATIHFIAPIMIKNKLVYLRGNTANWSDGVTGKDHRIDYIVPHDGFNEVTLEDDFAIIKVKEPFNGPNERLIHIARRDYKYAGSATIFGWGSIAPEKIKEVDILQAVTVDIWNTKKCREVYNVKDATVIVTNSMLCAGNEGKDTCTKDGGGPMVQNNILIGIISWGFECGNAKYPSVYSNISYFDVFIKRTEKNNDVKFMRNKNRILGNQDYDDYYCRKSTSNNNEEDYYF